MRGADLRPLRLRLRVAETVVLAAFLLLTVRAAHLTLLGERGEKRGESQLVTALSLPPERGRIVDRQGNELALTVSVPSVYGIPSAVKDPAATAARLAHILGSDAERAQERLSQHRAFVYIERWVDPAKVEKLKADLKEQQKEVATLETELKAAQDRQVDFDLFQAAHQELSAKVEKLKSQKASSEATAALDNSTASLDARLARGQDLLYAVSDFWRRKAEAEKAQEKIGQVEAEVTLYDTLAKALAPDGLPSRLIAEALGPVNDLLDVASVHLFPGRSLALTEALDIELSGCPFATLSKSAKFRVGVAFQYVLAKLAGDRLLVIDEADLLDPSNRTALIDFLLEIQPDFDTIIIFATSQEAKPSPIPEIQIWWLESGRIRPVETDDAACDQAAG